MRKQTTTNKKKLLRKKDQRFNIRQNWKIFSEFKNKTNKKHWTFENLEFIYFFLFLFLNLNEGIKFPFTSVIRYWTADLVNGNDLDDQIILEKGLFNSYSNRYLFDWKIPMCSMWSCIHSGVFFFLSYKLWRLSNKNCVYHTHNNKKSQRSLFIQFELFLKIMHVKSITK